MKLQNMLTKVLTRGIRGVVVAGVASVFFASSPVLAKGGGSGVVTALNLYYQTLEQKDEPPSPGTASNTKSGETGIDLNIGYAMSNGLYLGFLYGLDTLSSTTAAGVTTTPTYSGYGPSVGYIAPNGFFVTGSYILSASFEKLNSAGAKYTKGSGIQADFGYQMNVAGNFLVGLLMTYRSVSYTNLNDGTTDIAYKYTATQMYPQIRLGFMF
jgi:hypothetical protein